MTKVIFLIFIFLTSLFSITVKDATILDFMEIKGIGEKTANRLIEYRDSHELQSINDLIKVKGVGKKKLERIKIFFNESSDSISTSSTSKSEIDLTKYDD